MRSVGRGLPPTSANPPMPPVIQPCPTESVEQQLLFNWVEYAVTRYPELRLLYHVPNGGKRTKSEAGRFRAEGVQAGVPDLCLPVARGKYHGLYIEMKRMRGGVLSKHQSLWLRALKVQGDIARWYAKAGEKPRKRFLIT